MTSPTPLREAPPPHPPLEELLDTSSPEVTEYLRLRKRNQRLFIAVGLVIILLTIGWVIWRLNVRANANAADIDTNEAQIEAQQELIDGLAVALDEAISQGAAVQTPEEIAAEVPAAEVTPLTEEGDRGASGPPGPAGPPGVVSTADVEAAVAEYCAGGVCRGPAGPAGLDGAPGAVGAVGPAAPPPTDAQVAAAVTAYCSNGACVGPQGAQGATGARGEPGATGSSGEPGSPGEPGRTGAQGEPGSTGAQGDPGPPGPQGAPGPGPTDRQIAQAVSDYCTANACAQGPAGPAGADSQVPGPAGPVGPAGPEGPPGDTPSNLTCIPSDPTNLGAPWSCIAA